MKEVLNKAMVSYKLPLWEKYSVSALDLESSDQLSLVSILMSISITQSLIFLSTIEIGKANVTVSSGLPPRFITRVRVGNEHVLKMSSFVRPSLNATSTKDDFERGLSPR